MVLNINISLPDEGEHTKEMPVMEHEISVSEELSSVSKTQMELIIEKMAKVLDSQGISCFRCPKSKYKLFPLSDACREEYLLRAREDSERRFGLIVLCGNDKSVCTFELTLSPLAEKDCGRI